MMKSISLSQLANVTGAGWMQGMDGTPIWAGPGPRPRVVENLDGQLVVVKRGQKLFQSMGGRFIVR